MILHVMDELIRIPGRGVALLVNDGDAGALSRGGFIRDVDGRSYRCSDGRACPGCGF